MSNSRVLSDPWFIQRMNRRDNEVATGFDSMFSLDYMGASEFETGEQRRSLIRLREGGEIATGPVTVFRPSGPFTFHLVAHRPTVAEYAPRFARWAADERPHAQESVRFDTLGKDDYWAFDSWWDLKNDVMFTTDADIAADLITAIGIRPVTSK